MLHDHPIGFPACFTSNDSRDHHQAAAITRSGQTVFASLYRTKIADQCRLITVTWCKNMMHHGLSVSVQGPEGESQYSCKVEIKPWCFWRRQGSKRFVVDGGKAVDVFWDLKAAKFNGETEPLSDFYVAVVCDEEVVLLLGDLKKDAYRKTGCRPALIDPTLVSRKEHVFGKKRFATRVKFQDKGRVHEISIECKNSNHFANGDSNANSSDSSDGSVDPEMEIKIDGNPVVQVKHLQWKFRGNESINLRKFKVEVYWDVHDLLFSPGLRNGFFIFKPVRSIPLNSSISSPSTPLSSNTGSSGSLEALNPGSSSDFCLFLYAWKVD